MRQFEAKSLRARIEDVFGPRIVELELSFRPMFGGITGYASGRNFVSLSNVGMALKLDAKDRAALLAVDGARPLQYEPGGPVSKSSVVLPDSILDDDRLLRDWLRRSIDYCRAQPPKARRPRKHGLARP
jgi:TfoX/Sxy family transcriptional regulator of competence genes